MEGMRSWDNLGVVETIYEEEHEHEHEDYTISTPSPSLSLSSSPTPLHSRVESWSVTTGCEPDVMILIQKSCFHLHKDPLASRSGYLKRQMLNSSQFTLSPPLKITADTFTLVADFCYSSHLFITPFNVAALRTAAELLEMTEVNETNGDNLRQKTEKYFERAVVANSDYASIVLRSCLSLLPEAETTAALLSRCIQALNIVEDGGDIIQCFDEVKLLSPEDFQLVAASLHRGFVDNHDLLYRVVDLYLKDHDGKITEDQKSRLCNYIDCTYLSPQFLMHAVQNPRMPLRFIVQAMFIEQLNTRRSVISAATAHNHQSGTRKQQHRRRQSKDEESATTLGAILQRDATLRQVAQLKATMDATSSRIQSLEKELSGMKRIINDSENSKDALLTGKSESFRFSSSDRKVERGQRGSVSSGYLRDSKIPNVEENGVPYNQRGNFGRRLIKGLKSALRVSASSSKSGNNKIEKNGGKVGDVNVIRKDQAIQHNGLAF